MKMYMEKVNVLDENITNLSSMQGKYYVILPLWCYLPKLCPVLVEVDQCALCNKHGPRFLSLDVVSDNNGCLTWFWKTSNRAFQLIW